MEVESTLHPHPLPDSHHRKIELQSAQDLTYLQSNLIASARQKLDLHFPPSAAQQQPRKAHPATVISLDGVKPAVQDSQPAQEQVSSNCNEDEIEEQEDPMRASVRAYVDAFISRIYGSASHSITVNGLDVTSLPPTTLTTKHPAPVSATDTLGSSRPKEEKEGVDFSYEAHDTRLQRKVADLYAELESLTVHVGQLRRVAPKQGAEAFGRHYNEIMEGEDEEFEREVATLKQDAAESDGIGVLTLNPLPDGWFEDRRVMYERGTNELAALAGLANRREDASVSTGNGPSLTETVGRVQRARTVAMEFE
jgi:kinetochor protein Mis14/NSL1